MSSNSTAFASSDAEITVLNAIYDYLVDVDAANNPVPRLANAWTVSEDGLVYSFEPELGPTQDPRFIVLGAYDAPYKVAAEGSMLVANLSYKHPVTWKLADSLTFYNDFSYLKKREDSFSSSLQNVIGVLVSSGKLFTYIDAAFGKNHPWIGSDYGRALAEGQPDADWELRFNINVGYYF